MAINTTGTADTRDYFLGRGKLYIAELSTGSLPGAYRDLGNAPTFNFSVEEETLEHFSSRSGTRTLDKRLVLSKAVNVAFSLDELNHRNVGLFFGGTVSSVTNPAVAGVGSDGGGEIVITTSVELGRAYPLLTSYAGSGTGVAFSASSVPVITEDPSGTPVDLTEGTDYTIDKDSGLLFILATATNVSNGDTIAWYSAADASAPATLDVMGALKESTKTYALRFEGVNPANNDEPLIVDLYSVQISADGDLSMIGDELSVMSFSGAAQENSVVGKTFDWRTNVRS